MEHFQNIKILDEIIRFESSDPLCAIYTIEFRLPENQIFDESEKLSQALSAAGYDAWRLDVLGLAIELLVNSMYDCARQHGIDVYLHKLYRCDEDVDWCPFDEFIIKATFYFEDATGAEKFKSLIG